MTRANTFDSIWDAIGESPEAVGNLKARAQLMEQISALITKSQWNQTEAATHCGVSQPRVNDLLRGKISRFSLDALVNIATHLGQTIEIKISAA